MTRQLFICSYWLGCRFHGRRTGNMAGRRTRAPPAPHDHSHMSKRGSVVAGAEVLY
jgi:hypothetical protein